MGNLILKLVCFLQLFDLSTPFGALLESFLLLYGRKTKSAKWHPKECSNQKVEENKPALKLNFPSKYTRAGSYNWNWVFQRALLCIPVPTQDIMLIWCRISIFKSSILVVLALGILVQAWHRSLSDAWILYKHDISSSIMMIW